MTNSGMNPKVDFYFDNEDKWQDEIKKLRTIVLGCDLTEELKWGVPCYTYEKNNVLLIHVFKEYCAVLFVKGVLLRDAHRILIQQTENVQAGRQIRFTNLPDIEKLEPILNEYIYEAIEVEKSGLEVTFKKNTEYVIPDELKKKFEEDPALKKAFEGLTPGRQNGYIYYFSEPKQSKTRESRIEKYIPQILRGKGLKD